MRLGRCSWVLEIGFEVSRYSIWKEKLKGQRDGSRCDSSVLAIFGFECDLFMGRSRLR